MVDHNHLSEIRDLRDEIVTNQNDKDCDYIFKVIIIGDAGSGKSSLLKRLVQKCYVQGQTTVGVEFNSFLIRIEDKLCKLHIWDTAGQENFRSVTKVYYRSTQAVLLCFPIDSKAAFENLQHWLGEIRSQCPDDVVIFLTGLKSDLDSVRKVTREMGMKFQRENDLCYFIENSALDGSNIEKLFVDMSKFMYSRFHEEMDEAMRDNSVVAGQSERADSTLSYKKNQKPVQVPAFGTVQAQVVAAVAKPQKLAAPVQEEKKGGCC